MRFVNCDQCVNTGPQGNVGVGESELANPFDDLVSRRNYRHALFFLGLFFIPLGFFFPRLWLQVWCAGGT